MVNNNVCDISTLPVLSISFHTLSLICVFVSIVLPGLSYQGSLLTHEQLFFLSFAQPWCGAARPAEAYRLLLVDPHSPARYRYALTCPFAFLAHPHPHPHITHAIMIIMHHDSACLSYIYHSVIGSVSNSEEFAAAYKCPIGSAMNPKDKCRVW
jgi:hypothetical protein